MGLKQDVQKALAEAGATPSTKTVQPVDISPEATRALSQKVREWSGWSDARLLFGTPEVSPHAECDHTTHTFTAHAETLILNPHRVLLTVTPFRLRQEAVLTGALLHEAGHARHTLWKPRVEADLEGFKHSDGSEVTPQEFALASLMEEPRIEGMQARDADRIGAAGLGWTMRASAAHLIPTTVLNVTSPEQKIMDMITSWALRAGRQIALNHYTAGQHKMRNWVQDFTTLLHKVILTHLYAQPKYADMELDGQHEPSADAHAIMNLLVGMICCEDDRGPTMVDLARDVLTLLFPETPPEDQPMPGSAGCGEVPSDEGEEGDEGEQGETAAAPAGGEPEEGESEEGEPEQGSDEGSEGGSEDDEDSDEGEGQSEGDEPGDQPEDSDESGEGEGEPDEGATPSTEQAEPSAQDKELAAALAALEASAKSDATEETEEEIEKVPPMEGGKGAGSGGPGGMGGGFRNPTKAERDIQKGAERFLRDLISPTESSKVSLTDSPSATVDPAALAAWKADGGTRDPRFFKRTRREVEPAPPVKVAILVDVSGSMEELQRPSAILSWALAAAAMDLRNFAGRGQQLESTLIHWGSNARVIQRNGEMIPGIREVPCNEGTSAMGAALALVEEQLPGFFDITERPVHRLLVQFTDWELWGRRDVIPPLSQAMAAGVNMVTVAPSDYSPRRSELDSIMRACTIQRGTSRVLKYNRKNPEQVWDEAAKALL